MKKRVKVLASVLFLCFMTSQTVFAEMPVLTVVIGDNAFSIEYVNNHIHSEEINKLKKSEKNIYVKSLDGKWLDNKTGQAVQSNIIPEVTYKDQYGKVTKFLKGDGKELNENNLDDVLLWINIKQANSGIGQVVEVELSDVGSNKIKSAYKYEIMNNSGEIISKDASFYEDAYIYPVQKQGNSISLRIVDYQNKELITFENIKVQLDKFVPITENHIKKAKVVYVNTAEELLKNIGPNKTIILKKGEYDLLNAEDVNNDYIRYEEVNDGKELIIDKVNNLTIKGENTEDVKLLVDPRYASVLTFENSYKINICNVTAGHYPQDFCFSGVFKFDFCNDVNIDNCVLYGCGKEGIYVYYTNDLTFSNSVIKECSYGIMSLSKAQNIKFINSNFYDNKDEYMFGIYKCNNIEFDKCNIHDNKNQI